MKKLLLVSALATIVVSTAAYAATRIEVFKGDARVKISVDDLKTESVCSFKATVADKFDMSMKKFDLRKNGSKLGEGKTLYGAGVRFGNKIEVKDNTHSFQCT
ncbi:MAG: hypothetical protein COB37_11455 [Kordiimonadales bacterium]|nr:MAG: hypothetical protein COB37_11455 [Kordiimonadales bacterium]